MKEIILVNEELAEKRKFLNKIESDSSGWLTYYIDDLSQKWVEEYPNSEQHGGGISHLRLIDKFPWE